MYEPELLTISVAGQRYEGALLHGAGGVCETRAHALKWLQRCQSREQNCMVHLNFSHRGSKQIQASAADITIHQTASSQ